MQMETAKPKVKCLMDLFSGKRQSQRLPQPKLNKKVKLSEQKEDDPLYKLLSWRDEIPKYQIPPQETYRLIPEDSITESDCASWGTHFQAVFINVNWNATTIHQFRKTSLPSDLISNGIIFSWGNKTNLGEMMDYFQQNGFFYVENFTFVLLDRNKLQDSKKKRTNNSSLLSFFPKNKGEPENSKCPAEEVDYQLGKISNAKDIFLNHDSPYFKESQKILYMFRKVNKKEPLELRHQRTSDVYFTIGNGNELDYKSKQIVYKMIETLLITANYQQGADLKMLELWGDCDRPRKGWVTVYETPGIKSDSLTIDKND